MKEQVARILGNMAHEIEQCDFKDPVVGLEIKQATQQICRLSQERVEGIRQFIEDYYILLPRKFDAKYNTHSNPNNNILAVFDEWQALKGGVK